jgi:uncharacterized protein (DUF1499 family)
MALEFFDQQARQRKNNRLVSHPTSWLAASLILVSIFSCAGARPSTLGVRESRLAPCPSSPNCVSSDDADPGHSVAAFELMVPANQAWRAVRAAVASLPRVKIVRETADYLHAECGSAVFGFIDDLELHLRPAQNLIAARSAARLGYSDFGVNRRRVENLRTRLAAQGVIR